MRVKLVVTGDLEKSALAKSLARYFREDANGAKIEFLGPRKIQGVTTNPLAPVPAQGIHTPTSIRALAKALIAEVWPGANGKPADLVVAIDDLELANQAFPERVTRWVRRGVKREVERRAADLGIRSTDELQRRIRERCSFHMLAPMVEAYFFGDDGALRCTGVSHEVEARVRRPDVEDFETDDPHYLPYALAQNERRHARGYTWWRHERHPKHYLEHLCARSGRSYGETIEGKRALEELRWGSIPADERSLAFARALFQDLADAFGVDNPMGAGELAPATYPAKTVRRSRLLLRNL